MKAAVLARGLARRMRAAGEPAALSPEQATAAAAGLKAMMPIGPATDDGRARPFLDYILSELADAGVLDVALVVAPEHDAVRRRYTAMAPMRVALTFLVQTEARGTADAVLACERWAAGDDFLVLNGDNLYPAEVLRPLVALDTPGLPVFRRADLVEVSNFPADRIASFALLAVGPDGYLQGIVEKPDAAEMARAGDDGWVSMNLWRFDARIFGACRDVPRSARGEYELPVAVGLALERGVPFKALPASGGILDLSSRSDVLEVSRRLGSREVRP